MLINKRYICTLSPTYSLTPEVAEFGLFFKGSLKHCELRGRRQQRGKGAAEVTRENGYDFLHATWEGSQLRLC